MNIKQELIIAAKSEQDAKIIAEAMASMSGVFTAKEWQQIAQKMQTKIVQMRIRLLLT